jgi:hypothetical protein
MKILIIGVGGYIDAVVLPIITKLFKPSEIYIASHNSLKSHNLSMNLGLSVHTGLLDKYDFYFLNTPIWDYSTFLDLIPNNKPLWIEKPISDIANGELETINKCIEQRNSNTYVGFNQRKLYGLQSIMKSKFIEGSLDFRVEFNKSVLYSQWKHCMIEGGIFYTDGIHAIDLALFILGEKSLISNAYTKNPYTWIFEVVSERGKIIVTIGNIDKNKYILNSNNIIEQEKVKNLSQTLFKRAFEDFLKGDDNYICSYQNSLVIRDAIRINNLTNIYK